MNVNSGGPHLLLFERDQQLTTLLSNGLAQAGYEVHTARTAVEVFDAIARFPVRLVMVDLAQAQAGRREFWVALDAQRRGRGVQVFTYRCANLGGFGPEDPDERIETVLTDLEVDGPGGTAKLVEAVRTRVPGSTVTPSAPTRPVPGVSEAPYQSARSVEASFPPPLRQASPIYQPPRQASPIYQSVPIPQGSPVQQPAPMYQQMAMPDVHQAPSPQMQPLQGILRPPPQEIYAPPPPPPARPAEPPRSGHSTFTDKIRAVFYPSSQSFSSVPETTGSPSPSGGQAPHVAPYQNPDVQPRPHASQRFAEAEYQLPPSNREEMTYQSPINVSPVAPTQAYSSYTGSPSSTNAYSVREESGLDQLTRMLRESQPTPQNTMINGNIQNSVPQPALPVEAQEVQDFRSQMMPQNAPMNGTGQYPAPRPGLTIDPQEIQDFRSQIMQAARMDEAHERSNTVQPHPVDIASVSTQLRASPIQDIPFEQEVAHRKGPAGNTFPQVAESFARPTATGMQQSQVMPQMSQRAQPAFADAQVFSNSGTQPRPVAPPETPVAFASASQMNSLSPIQEASPQADLLESHTSGPLSLDEEITLAEQVRASLQQTISRRPEVRTSDDMLLDIVKSLPAMSPAPQPPPPQPQVLNGRATRSLGSVLLEGHLVPQERLNVAQHVQRMLRGVDLNYQLGEILLMFKLLTPDQLLAASLVSYGMISTIQISALGRIRQELHAMGLEYDLESLLVLFRILSPEQLREVRASWSG